MSGALLVEPQVTPPTETVTAIAGVQNHGVGGLVALCADGTLWITTDSTGLNWRQIPSPPMPAQG